MVRFAGFGKIYDIFCIRRERIRGGEGSLTRIRGSHRLARCDAPIRERCQSIASGPEADPGGGGRMGDFRLPAGWLRPSAEIRLCLGTVAGLGRRKVK